MTAKTEPAGHALTRIAGIGPRLAERLARAGVRTVEQLADASVEQVVAACGRTSAPTDRAQSWIAQAARLTKEPGRTSRPHASQRTFTVEARVDGDPAHVETTRVIHTETDDADGWPGWDPARLVDFIESRLGVGHSAAEPVEESADSSGAEPGEDAPEVALAVHRFGVLRAGAPLMRRGRADVRLLLDPSELELPTDASAVARVELLARPMGAGREQVLARRQIDLSTGQTVDAVLGGRLPNHDPPFILSATVRILVSRSSDRPHEGLGRAMLIVADR